MRSVVAAFLAPFLVATPLTQVLAQTGQQGPRVVQTEDFRVTIPVPTRTFQTSERPLLLTWVPSVERNSPAALLWAAGAIDNTAAESTAGSPSASGVAEPIKVISLWNKETSGRKSEAEVGVTMTVMLRGASTLIVNRSSSPP